MKICFFCASSEALDEKYYSIAKKFGTEIAKKNWTLVSGGANVGLMKTLVKTISENKGKSIGIIPRFFDKRNLTCHDNTEIVLVKDMQERKKILFDISDAFVILPGGFGTLDELLEIITLKQIGQANKPIIIFNQDGFYNHLLKQFEVIFDANFAKSSNQIVYFTTENIETTFNYIENYKDAEIDSKWVDVSKGTF